MAEYFDLLIFFYCFTGAYRLNTAKSIYSSKGGFFDKYISRNTLPGILSESSIDRSFLSLSDIISMLITIPISPDTLSHTHLKTTARTRVIASKESSHYEANFIWHHFTFRGEHLRFRAAALCLL